MNWDILHVLQARSYAAYTVIGGWSLTPGQISIALSRLLYPFFAGLLISRINKLIKVRAGFWWCSLLIAAILVMPIIGGADKMWMNGIYESISIIVIFPLIVLMGAGSNVTGRTVNVCKFFGEISYPLYIIHYPLVYLQVAWVSNHPEAKLGTHIFVSVSIYLLAIATSYACLKLYDIPVRKWLKENWLMK